jgi:hypothetical protein
LSIISVPFRRWRRVRECFSPTRRASVRVRDILRLFEDALKERAGMRINDSGEVGEEPWYPGCPSALRGSGELRWRVPIRI